MHPELLAAVKERINLGHSKEEIRAELHAAGYDDPTIEQVYAEAFAELQPEAVSNVPKPTDVPRSDPSSIEGGSSTVVLPSASTLFSNGWNFMMSRPDLVMVLGAPFAVTALFGFIFGEFESSGVILTTSIVGLVALVVYIYAWAASLYTVSVKNEHPVDLTSAFAWAKRNILGLIWVNLLAGLVVSGGYVLFVIPGIILSVSLYLAQYLYVKENVRGMAALLRSRDLVKGHWWTLIGRLFVLGLIFILAFLFLGGLMGIMVRLGGENGISDLITDILLQFIGAGATLISFHAGMEIYSNLAAARPPATAMSESQGRGKYVILAWLGLTLPLVVMFLLLTVLSVGVARDSVQQAELDEMQMDTDSKERALEMRAEQLRQDIIEAEEGGATETIPLEGVDLDQIEEIPE